MIHPEIQKWVDTFVLRTPEEIIKSCRDAGYYSQPLCEISECTSEDITAWIADGAAKAGANRALAEAAVARGLSEAASDADKPKVHVDEPWPEPKPLPSRTHEAPPLDPDILPDSLRAWIVDASSVASMPLEYVAIPAMVALGTVVGRRVAICPEVFEPGWSVKGNIWGVIVGDSGQRKSSAIRKGLAHLRPIERMLLDAWEQVGPSVEAQRINLEKVKKGGKGIDEHDQEDAIQKLKDLPTGARRIRTNDATVEKLACMLNDNPDGLLIERDELSSWLKTMDKQGRENERGFYLEGWAGDGTFTQDRISRATIHVPAVCLSVIGTLQPGPLSEYLSGATSGGSKADGMIQRLQLLTWPDHAPKYRKADRFPDEGAAQQAEGVYSRIYRTPPRQLGAELRSSGARVPAVVYDSEGQAVYDRWHEEFEGRLTSRELTSRSALCSHMSKYRSLVPKLSLLLHLADHQDGSPVSALSALRAVAWVRWLESHALKVYAPEESGCVASARALAEKIQLGLLGDRFVAKDVYRNHWLHLDTRDAVVNAIAILRDMAWLRIDKVYGKTKPTTMVTINPQIER
jgi:putative DNA primase/helicase